MIEAGHLRNRRFNQVRLLPFGVIQTLLVQVLSNGLEEHFVFADVPLDLVILPAKVAIECTLQL